MRFLLPLLFVITFIACSTGEYKDINGFSSNTNEKLSQFFNRMKSYNGRKIAVFDGDGTVLGQTPHYLADECLYKEAEKRPDYRKKLIKKMSVTSNVSIPYVQYRIHYLSGKTLKDVRLMGEKCFKKDYSNKIYEPMKKLIGILKANNFEVWIVTASPEALYQGFLSKSFGIPITHIVGVKSVVSGGIVTKKIVHPIPQDHGKKEAIETFIQDRPQFVAGNSRGDKEMIEYSSDISMIINPDTHIAQDQKISIADYAKKKGWLIAHINDVPEKMFPSVSSKKFNVRINKTKKVKKD